MSAKGEKYASKKAMMKHEGSEGSKERKMEYGTAKKAKLGSGARFKAVAAAAKKGGAKNPAAVAAAIGRKKYGKAKFQKAADFVKSAIGKKKGGTAFF